MNKDTKKMPNIKPGDEIRLFTNIPFNSVPAVVCEVHSDCVHIVYPEIDEVLHTLVKWVNGCWQFVPAATHTGADDFAPLREYVDILRRLHPMIKKKSLSTNKGQTQKKRVESRSQKSRRR